MSDAPDWIKRGGVTGELKKIAIIGLISLSALALPLYRLFLALKPRKRRPKN